MKYLCFSALILSNLFFCDTCKGFDRKPIGEHERVFSWIYDYAIWGKNDQGCGFSGGGSLFGKYQRIYSLS